MGFPGGSAGKESACNAGDPSSIPGLGRSAGEGIATHSSLLGLFWWLSWLRIHPQCGRPGFDLCGGKIPWRRERLPTPVFWPGGFHGLCHGVTKSQTQLSNFHFQSPGFITVNKHLPTPTPCDSKDQGLRNNLKEAAHFLPSISVTGEKKV